jgi:two-component system, OmpR family, response regulator ChvI
LLVDDEPDNSSIFRIALEDNGFDVDAFNNPTLALSSFKPDYYDLLVLDIKMPNMNGYELYQKIKKMDDKVKVCFLTAFGEQYTEEFKTRFTPSTSPPSSSSDDISFIRKPVMLDKLVKTVNEIIAK